MDEIVAGADPHAAIERLEERIEQIAARLENCRKFMLAARVAMALGAAVLLAGLFGLVRFDVMNLSIAFAAVLGGIVVFGSNSSTSKEAAAQLTEAERNRAALIGTMELRAIAERATLH